MNDDPRSKTYREHLRHCLGLCTNLKLTASDIDAIINEVAGDEGMKQMALNLDSHMAEKGDENKLLLAWECTKLYAADYLKRNPR